MYPLCPLTPDCWVTTLQLHKWQREQCVSPARQLCPVPPVEFKYCCFQPVLAVGGLSPSSRCAASFPGRKALWGQSPRQLPGVNLRDGSHSPAGSAGQGRIGRNLLGLGLPGLVQHRAGLAQQPVLTMSWCSFGDGAWDSQPRLSTG